MATIEYLTVEHLSTKDLTRIFSFVYIHPDVSWNGTSCWIWTGVRMRHGHGQTYWRLPYSKPPHQMYVHRLFFAWLVHPVPRGKKYGELDHLCRITSCCNPAHLEFVSHKINVLRGESIVAKQARQTHCKHGHPLSGNNLFRSKKGHRLCRTCGNLKYQRNPEPQRTRARERARRIKELKIQAKPLGDS